MPYQNRVDPWGNIVRSGERGAFMGNRGVLHDASKQIVRPYQTTRWIICLLAFKGRRREVLTPGQYTELFFLDEASAMAAGHRPCAECQRSRFAEFKRAWLAANPLFASENVRIEEIDAVLQRERIAKGEKVTYRARLSDLPEGTFFSLVGKAYLVHGGRIHLWSFAGYTQVDGQSFPDEVDVLTPRSSVNAFRNGFVPQVQLANQAPNQKRDDAQR